MGTFIFTLTPDASASAVERVIAELDAAFPQHEFLAGDADIGGFDNSILAVYGSAGSGDLPGETILPNMAQVSEVKMVFRQIIEDLKGWKPS
ncbi:hypothetical protein SAMN05216374_0946 [Tardiphaga sp. OK246]|uniref:hypothetical protein n=1 Tax=Tardiphaga sp. OK246 TaxID=1855307 RepID=UPI000B701673|nr:hypothetical protein [Tardiphaga sp. OK246]SNS35382.1 hypothetical protein SAMN05216374_0946 [Tardiphaga sp. OK246]